MESSILLAEAEKIGNRLLQTSIKRDDQLYWNFYSLHDNEVSYGEQSSMYKGTCGVIYYLCALYNVIKKDTYLSAAIGASRYIEDYHNRHGFNSPALLTGCMSVSVTFFQLFETTGQAEFREKAIYYAKTSKDFLQFPITDYINGIGGSTLGLLKIYLATGNAEIAEILYQFVCELIDRIYIHRQGFYWDISPDNIKGLCGFSHGASGIAAVFLELYAAFDNPAFLWIADQAILYETQYYDNEQRNWMDFRMHYSQRKQHEELKAIYINGQIDPFIQPGFMNAWCHGAAGIALCRLRAYELTNNRKYLPDIKNCVHKIVDTSSQVNSLSSYTLCHGHLGNMEALIEAGRVLKTEAYSSAIYLVTKKAIEENNRKGFYSCGFDREKEDPGLFLGSSGIGYFYLRLFDPAKTPSLLYLYGNRDKESFSWQTDQPFKNITAGFILERIFKKHFSGTHAVLRNTVDHDKMHFYDLLASKKLTLSSLKKNFIKNIATLAVDKSYLSSLFQLELTCTTAYTSPQSHALVYLKELLKHSFKQKVNALPELSDETELVSDPAIIYVLKNKMKYGALPMFHKSFIYEIGPLSDHILTYFKTPLTIKNMLALLFSDQLAEQSKEAETIIKQQIRELILAGLLLLAEDHINCIKNLNN